MAIETRRQLLAELALLEERLHKLHIRRASDYAEQLIAEALGGHRMDSGVNKGFDVVTPEFGRVEVKCRQLPPDGRREQRIEIGEKKRDGFDHCAIVIFELDYAVKSALIIPYHVVWAHVEVEKYRRINYSTAHCLPQAVDITALVRKTAEQ